MEYWTRVLGYVSLAEFVFLTVVTSAQWRRNRAHVGWFALTFGILGGTSVLTQVDASLLTNANAVKTLLVLLVLVPYCLFRFTTSFHDANPVVDFVAVALTAGVIASTFALPNLTVPAFGSPTGVFSPQFPAYAVAFASLFGFLSTYVVTQLVRASGGQPPVAAYRMRLSAVAVATLGVGFVVSAPGVSVFGPNGARTALSGQALLVAAGALFLVALAFPSLVRTPLRRCEDLAIRRAVSELVSAAEPVDLTERILRRVGALVGATAVALLEQNGAVVAQYPAGRPEDGSWELGAAGDGDDGCVLVRTSSGAGHEFAVLVDPYLRYFGTEELRELDQLAALAGLALERCQTTAHTVFRASHDGLTGLTNRTRFVEQLRDAMSHFGRRRRALAVLFIDLDRFKHVNDELDHAAGDAVLVAVANRLTALMRGVDVVARFGGDEFVAFAEVDHERDAVDVAERLRSGLGAPVAVGVRQVTLTASIGVAVTSDEWTTPAELLREADHAMYDAKRSGRDRVVLARARARDVAARRWGMDHPQGVRVSAG